MIPLFYVTLDGLDGRILEPVDVNLFHPGLLQLRILHRYPLLPTYAWLSIQPLSV